MPMDDTRWKRLKGLWTGLEALEAERKELNQSIATLKKRLDEFIKSGEDPADDGQVPMFDEETRITLETPDGKKVTGTQSQFRKALDELNDGDVPPPPEVPR